MYQYCVCFLIRMFRCVKFQESNDKAQLIFGSVTNIQAKDAAPVEVNAGRAPEKLEISVLYNLHNWKKHFFCFFFFKKIDTMLVLESSGNLVLYTGVVRVRNT